MDASNPSVARHILLHSLSLSFYAAWAAILLRFTIYPGLDGLPLYALIPVAIAGFLSATLLDRFLVRRAAFAVGLAAFALNVGLSFLVCFVQMPGAALAAVSFFLFLDIFILVVPMLKASAGVSLYVFNGVLFSAVLLMLAPLLLISGAENPYAAVACACVSLCAGFALSLPARKSARPDSDLSGRLDVKLKRPGLILFCVITYAGCLVLTAQTVRLLSDVGSAAGEAGVFGALLFVIMQAASFYLIRSRRVWQLSYVVFTAFALGAVMLLSAAENVMFVFLPLMLFISSLSGMLLFFFSFMQNLLSEINRPFMSGFVYLSVFPLAFALILPRESPGGLLSALTGEWSLVIVAAVLLVSPIFLRTMDREGASPGSEDAGPRPDSRAEPELGAKALAELEMMLTGAERRVYEFILLGYSNQQIADELYISINTVKFHVRNILAKSGMQRKNQLVSLYLQRQK